MKPDRPRSYEVLGILMKFHAFPDDVQGKYCLIEAVVPPGLGAPPNRHPDGTEAFHVLDGQLEFTVDGETRSVGKGDHVTIPDGAPHSFSATGDKPARVLILNAPGHMHERFFTELGSVVTDDRKAPAPLDGPPDIAVVMAAADAAGMILLPPPGV